MGHPGKAWEIPRRHGKSPKSIGNPGITWEIPVKHGKSKEIWESTENLRKRCEILENAVKQEMLLKPGK